MGVLGDSVEVLDLLTSRVGLVGVLAVLARG